MNHMVLMAATSVGWVGAVGTVGAYALVSRRRMDANSVRFQAVNVAGAGLLAVSALSAANWPSMVSNLVWMYFGLHALVKARHALAPAVVERWRALVTGPAVPDLPAGATEPEAAASSGEVALAA
jgi:hypothetical protein